MSRHARVVAVREPPDGRPGAATRPWPVSATATLAWAACRCGATCVTVVRPWETTGDVVDAMLRAAGWDPACDECPDCAARARADRRDALPGVPQSLRTPRRVLAAWGSAVNLTLDVIVAVAARLLGAPSDRDDERAIWRDRTHACGVIVEHESPLAPTRGWVLAAYWGDPAPVQNRYVALSIFPLASPLARGPEPRRFAIEAAVRRAAEELEWTVLAPAARHLFLVAGASNAER